LSGGSREPGWYPDPWGTEDERWFDGAAWTRSVRHPGGLQTPPEVPGATESFVVPGPEAPAPAPPAPNLPATAPPGWHPDPWAAASLRYWDGTQWTGHVAGVPGGPSASLRLGEERTAGRWARISLAWAGPAAGVGMIATAFQWRWIADHWDELSRQGSSVDSSGSSGAAVLAQLAGVALLAAGVLFLIWFYRAAALAASSGLPARRSPALATVSFIIPILNLWWPYQSTCDLLPQDHPGRPAVRRWWLLWIGFYVASLAIMVTAFQNEIALSITTGVAFVLALLAAIAGRVVVAEVMDAHDQLLAGT
jgi:hypothetical protein